MDDHDDIALSALEHYSYCPRQFGLIHIEQVWTENYMTVQGDHVHRRADEATVRHERGREMWRAVTLWSRRLRLFGRADVVEVLDDGSLVPVEYKRAGRRPNEHERIQVCAQALCLEEMIGTTVSEGALYHAASKRLIRVEITESLRAQTERAALEVHACFAGRHLPAPIYDHRCDDCSLLERCLPMAAARISATAPGELFDVEVSHGWVESE